MLFAFRVFHRYHLPDYLTQYGPWTAQWSRWNGQRAAAWSLTDKGFDWWYQSKSPLNNVPAEPCQGGLKIPGWIWLAGELRRGREGSLREAASPGSPTGKQSSAGKRGCPALSGQELHHCPPGRDALLLKQKGNWILIPNFNCVWFH